MTLTNRNPGAGNAGASATDHVLATTQNDDRGNPSLDRDQAHRCAHCATAFPNQGRGRPQKFCSDACRQAHRKSGASRGNGLRYRIPRPRPKSAPQAIETANGFTPENLSPKGNLRFERVNEATFKITDGEMTRVPPSHGQWSGYNTTRGLAWIIDVGIASPAWLVRYGNEARGPLPFNEAKAAAFAMVKGEAGDVRLIDPIKFMLRLQAELLDS